MKVFACYIDDKFVRNFVSSGVAMWWAFEMRKEGKNATYRIEEIDD